MPDAQREQKERERRMRQMLSARKTLIGSIRPGDHVGLLDGSIMPVRRVEKHDGEPVIQLVGAFGKMWVAENLIVARRPAGVDDWEPDGFWPVAKEVVKP